jgi:hypothetical protein
VMNSAATALRRQLDDDFCGRLPASGGRTPAAWRLALTVSVLGMCECKHHAFKAGFCKCRCADLASRIEDDPSSCAIGQS